jgi:hypothetical protein
LCLESLLHEWFLIFFALPEEETNMSSLPSSSTGLSQAKLHRKEAVVVTDAFFALGRHSLLVTQLLTRVSDALHVEIPFLEFVEAPTVAHMAMLIVHYLAAQVPHTELESLLTEIKELSEGDVQYGLAKERGKDFLL